jgi:parallel beta-helix repeat protein/predicted outer membrane repeat protein
MGSQTISDNIISDNSAHGYYGGGIHCDGSYPTIQNNTIEGNSGPMWGGGISCDHGYPVISGNTIRSNSAGSGGGVYCYSMVSILGNSITDNSASSGGGISCDTSTVEISDNTISDNWVYCSGGGIYSLRTDLVLTNNQILGNSSGEHGGGISCEGGTISNNTIAENTAEADGGGVWCEYVISFNNNTIVGNVAWGLGGGIYSFEFPGSRIRDCIVWNNGDDLYDCTATFCCVQDPDEGQGNIHDDPMFVSGPFGEYYLHPDSPCIDAGSRSAEDAGLSRMTTQTDGTPDTGTVDMGVHYPVPSDSSMRTSLQFHE